MRYRLVSLVLVLVLLVTPFAGCGNKTVNDILSDEASREIMQTRTLVKPDEPPALCINGTKAVYESEKNTYFFTISEEAAWEKLTPTLEGYTVAYQSNFEASAKEASLKANRGVYLLAYNDTSYMKLNVMFTTIPVLAIKTMQLPENYTYHDADEEVEVVWDEKTDMPIPYDPYAAPSDDVDAPIGDYNTFIELTLLDANAKAHGYENGFTSLARAHIRGRSSRAYPKNSYKIELLADENGVLKERDQTLLGMRLDGDWNLNGMYAEPTKVRDKVASDLWLAITADRTAVGASTGYRCEYVEVIINAKYHGLYLLTERIDHKQLGLKDGDYMYFSEGDIGKYYVQFTDVAPDDNDDDIAGYSLKFPKQMTDDVNEWAVFGELTKLVDVVNSETFAKTAANMIDVNSLADYEIFVQAAAACDNLIQNTYYPARLQADGSYKFEFVPWDLDQTFGNRWFGEEVDPLLTGEDYHNMVQYKSHFWVAERMKHLNAGGFMDIVKERYAALRKTVLNTDTMTKMVEDANARIVNSGAYARNKTRWPYGGYSIITDSLEDFITEHMQFVDTIYQ